MLHWLRSEAHRFKIFVAQRVGEIQEITNVTDWRYVPSKLNVADEATRRSRDIDFSEKSRWLHGPEFLLQSSNKWPIECSQNVSNNDLEE